MTRAHWITCAHCQRSRPFDALTFGSETVSGTVRTEIRHCDCLGRNGARASFMRTFCALCSTHLPDGQPHKCRFEKDVHSSPTVSMPAVKPDDRSGS